MNNDQSKKRGILQRQHWIFDLDGTLTLAVHDFVAIRKSLGIPDGEDILKHILNQDTSTASRMMQQLNEIEIELAEQSQPAVGVDPLIRLLSGRGARLGIITRNTKENAKRSLEKIGILGHFGDETILGRHEAPPKPDPKGISHLITLWNTSAEQTVMVGDYRFDLQAGRAAGTATIHVDSDLTRCWKDLTDIRLNTMEELVSMLSDIDVIAQFEN